MYAIVLNELITQEDLSFDAAEQHFAKLAGKTYNCVELVHQETAKVLAQSEGGKVIYTSNYIMGHKLWKEYND